MYKVDLPVDQSTEKAVERRRSAENARKARIFNTRLRVMGLDLDALNQQVHDRKQQLHTERRRDKAAGILRKISSVHATAIIHLRRAIPPLLLFAFFFFFDFKGQRTEGVFAPLMSMRFSK